MKQLLKTIAWIAILTVWAVPCMAAEGTWVTVEGSYPLAGITSDQARNLAVKEALRKAVEQVVGARVKAETLVIDQTTVGDVIQTEPSGRVARYRVVEYDILKPDRDALGHVAWVKIEAEVVAETEQPDPYFQIKAHLNRTSFKDNDDVVVTVESRAATDAYLYLFVVMSDEKVIRILPNQYKSDNLLEAWETFIYPAKADAAAGLGLVATLPGGIDQVNETLYVLALKQAYDFGTGIAEGVYCLYDGQTAFVGELVKMIAGIPRKDRTIEFISYEIRKQ